MGDYGLGLNSNARALSPVDFNQLSNNQSLFSPEILPPHTASTMQDETLCAVKQKQPSPQPQQHQPNLQLSPNLGDPNSSQDPDEAFRKGKVEGSSPAPEDRKNHDGIVSSPLDLGLSDPGNNSMGMNSLASGPNFWSTGTADDTFIQGFPAMNGHGTVTFQNFPPAANPLFNTNPTPQLQSSMSNFGPQQHQQSAQHSHQSQQQRRAITGQHNFQQLQQQQRQQQSNLFYNSTKTYPTWSSAPQQSSWSSSHQNQTTINPWGSIQQQRRPGSVPNHVGPIGAQIQQKKNMNSSVLISPSKFRRSTSFPQSQVQQPAIGTKPTFELTPTEEHRDGHSMLGNFPQERGTYDTMRFPALESHLLDIMRTTNDHHDQYKVAQRYPFPMHGRGYGKRQGKSPFGFGDDNHLLDDGGLDQQVPNINSPSRGSPNSQSGMERIERYSRKVFVGGLPPDIDEEEITAAFRRFGPLVVDWPHKAESKSYFPPKGYCFLLFQDEMSVQALIDACIVDDEKLYWCVSSPTMKDKPVQIRPWNLSDSDFVMDGSQPLDPRKTIFVGGVPRPLRAVELAMIMDRLYGGVCYAGIDTDPELKYPKGAGRVAFSNQQSYIAAISARFVQLQHGDIDKRVEVKPYVLDDQMCDECQGSHCGGKFAPFFCANVTCLQYYCEHCWAQIHSRPGREFHKPLVKEGADRPRAVPFRFF
ncbi:cytoplasmic polyadenylation element-binding protein 2-like isoform X2 [Lineus longissimus]|uniref:cytoplasmic polyadenylation element-binding protein 2-like isoform X2 n=1 Tax=Lineus longissimus TaxID=88925 RepID=UPI00315D5E85